VNTHRDRVRIEARRNLASIVMVVPPDRVGEATETLRAAGWTVRVDHPDADEPTAPIDTSLAAWSSATQLRVQLAARSLRFPLRLGNSSG
jgi:hypothetical protein